MKRNLFIIMLLGSFLMVPVNLDAHSPKNSVNVMTNDVSLKSMPVSKEIEELLKKAEQGDVESMYKLGKCYDKEENYVEANKWYLKAAQLGNGAAANELGLNYANGLGVEKNLAEANKWYRKGAELGNGQAACNLGYNYAQGNGVEKNYTEANKWYRKGAELGNGMAASNLGVNYYNGYGVEKSLAEANKWYRKGAELGNAISARYLGSNYKKGIGVGKNLAEARKWYRKGVELGDAVSALNLGLTYGSEEEENYSEAIKWYLKGAELGNGDAAMLAGLYYKEGKGVEKNLTEANMWLRKAVELGKTDAAKYITSDIDLEKENRDAAQLKQWSNKYGEKYAKALMQEGEILIGTPIQLITEYISYSKKYNPTARGAASFGTLACNRNDILRFGRSVRKYKLNILGISQTLWATNGKVVAKSDAYLF